MYVVMVKVKIHPERPLALIGFKDKDDFEESFDDDKKGKYRVIKKGLSKQQATKFLMDQGMSPTQIEESLASFFPQ
jgi:hypothetical protein